MDTGDWEALLDEEVPRSLPQESQKLPQLAWFPGQCGLQSLDPGPTHLFRPVLCSRVCPCVWQQPVWGQGQSEDPDWEGSYGDWDCLVGNGSSQS